MVVEAEMARLKKFQDSLSPDERLLFQDLLLECKLYAPYASVMASPVKEIPFLISMLFGQHKRIVELEKKIVSLQTVMRRKSVDQMVPVQNTSSQISTAT